MTPLQFAVRQRGIRRRLATAVRRLFALRGAPATDGQRIDLALELFRLVQRERVESYRFASAMLASEALRLDVDLRTRPMRRYDADALVKVLERATGVLPDAPLVEVRMLDPETRKMARRRVAVTEANRRDPAVVRQVSERTSRTVVRHAQQAGREAVEDTANASGEIVGWARLLSGTENCAFCAMLASRGAVFRSEHAAKYKNIAGTDTYHDGCDCQAVLVRKGVPWLGSKESERLSALWASSTRGKRGKNAVAAFSKAWRAELAREKESAQVAA